MEGRTNKLGRPLLAVVVFSIGLFFVTVPYQPALAGPNITFSNIKLTPTADGVGGNGQSTYSLHVTFDTNVPTTVTVVLNDQNVSSYKPFLSLPNLETSHDLVFKNLPSTTFKAMITATDANQNSVTSDPQIVQMVPVSNNSGTDYCPPTCPGPPAPGTGANNGTGNANLPPIVFPSEDPSHPSGTYLIKNVKVDVLDNRTARITWDTTSPATSIVYSKSIASQITQSFPGQTQPSTNGTVTFCDLEINGVYQFAITASPNNGGSGPSGAGAVYIYPNKVTLHGSPYGGNANCATGGQFVPNGTNTLQSSANGLNGGPLAGLLENANGDPKTLQLFGHTIDLSNLLWWVFLILVGASTLLEIFFFLKQRRLWGVVYDARTKQPIEMAIVRLFNEDAHKMLETRVTNKSGRYSFLADPGEYYLDVVKQGFHFPTRLITTSSDNEYVNIYRGEVIKLGAGQSLIAKDVPIDSESGQITKVGFYRRFIFPLLEAIRLPLLLFTLVALVLYGFVILQPTPLFFFLLSLLGVLFIIEFFFVRRGRK